MISDKMKIRIEISAENVSYVLDKETDREIPPQVLINGIEQLIAIHEHGDDRSCYDCRYEDFAPDREPCVNCGYITRVHWEPLTIG